MSGTFSGYSQQALEEDYITPLGATLAKTVTKSTTHLVTTESDFAKPSAKVKQARSHDLHIVKLDWLENCLDQAMKLNEDAYTFDSSHTALAPASQNTSLPPRKRPVIKLDESDDDDQSQMQPSKKSKSTNSQGSGIQSQTTSKAAPTKGSKSTIEQKAKSELPEGPTNLAKSSIVNVPVDEHCPLAQYSVYIDSGGLIYDASLNQTNSGNNNNKFYRVQVCEQ